MALVLDIHKRNLILLQQQLHLQIIIQEEQDKTRQSRVSKRGEKGDNQDQGDVGCVLSLTFAEDQTMGIFTTSCMN